MKNRHSLKTASQMMMTSTSPLEKVKTKASQSPEPSSIYIIFIYIYIYVYILAYTVLLSFPLSKIWTNHQIKTKIFSAKKQNTIKPHTIKRKAAPYLWKKKKYVTYSKQQTLCDNHEASVVNELTIMCHYYLWSLKAVKKEEEEEEGTMHARERAVKRG